MNALTTLTINDLHHADELDASAMARVTGGEKTYVNGDIIGTWANGTAMSIPML